MGRIFDRSDISIDTYIHLYACIVLCFVVAYERDSRVYFL
jgi:hypothetical protein